MLTYKLLTDKGERDNNEDCVGMLEKDGEYCFVLADGLGGHGFGEKASEVAVKNVLEYFYEYGLDGEHMGQAILKAQREILFLQCRKPEYKDMKTTIVVLHIKGNMARWAHVGDSRLYYFKKNKLIERTLDHSVPQNLVESREIKEKDIRHHADRNRLLRVLGTVWESPKYEISKEVELKQDVPYAFLLCSDGFWELIDEKKMVKYLKCKSDCQMWIEEMEKTVKEQGFGTGMDNYSAIGVFID